MSIRQYTRPRQSNAEWLGAIPDHWSAVRLKNLFEIRKRIAGELGHHVLSVTQHGLRIRNTDSNDGQLSMDYSKYQLVEPGDFVMNHMDLLTGYVDVSSVHGVTSPDYRVFAVRSPKLSRKYFLYVFQNGYRQRIFYAFGQGASGLGRWRMPTDSFNDFIVPVPPVSEQNAIATFLDRETGKIDALVEEQKRLIELLKAKRQAVISRAVTKGLKPDAQMKDSGVAWLGEVPKHWEVVKLNRFWSVTDCKHITADFVDDGIPVASIRECQGKFIDLSAAKQTTDDFYDLLIDGGRKPQPGDLIFTRNATVGEVSQVAEWHPPFAMGQDVCLLRKADSQQSTDFLQYVLSATSTVQQLALLMIGSTFKRVNVEEIRNLRIPLAPRIEQIEIVRHLNACVDKFDNLIAEAENAVDLLKERRAALISAAVTGKIDLREAAEAELVTA